MSNARSPREVCSTTIGTSGLTVLASFRVRRLNPPRRATTSLPARLGASLAIGRSRQSGSGPRRPELRRALFGLCSGSPELVAGLRLLDRDRLGGVRQEVERLALRELRLEGVEAAGGPHPLEQLVRARALRRRGLLERLEQLVLRRLDRVGGDDRGEHRLALELALGVGLALGDDVVLRAAGDLQVHLLRDALVAERVQHLLPQLARARLDQRLGDVDLRVRDGGVEHGLAELRVDAALLGLGQPLADVLAQLVERVEAGLGRELVVDRRQLLRLDLLDGHRELRVVAGELLRAVVIRERDLDGAFVARGRARELLLEAGHEPAGAELDHLVAAIAAGERLAVERALVIHHDEVARLGRALDGLEPAGALAQRLDPRLDLLVGGGRLALADLEALVVAELRLGPHADLDRERQRLAVAGQLAHVEPRLADWDDRGGVDRRRVPGADRVAHRLVEDDLAADALDHDGRGRLAGAEAGHAHAASERARRLRDALLDLLRRYLGLDAHARLRQLGHGCGDGGCGHGRPSRYRRPDAPPARGMARHRSARPPRRGSDRLGGAAAALAVVPSA